MFDWSTILPAKRTDYLGHPFWKPLPVVPPGQVGVYVTLPLSIVFFLLSIKRKAE